MFAAILSKFHPDAENDARLRRDSQQIVEYIREARFISLTAMSMSDVSEISAGSPSSAGSPQGSPLAGDSKGGALVDRFKRRSMVMKRKLRAMRVGEGRVGVVSLRTSRFGWCVLRGKLCAHFAASFNGKLRVK